MPCIFAEADGVEPSSHLSTTRQFSRLLHYQLCDASFCTSCRLRSDDLSFGDFYVTDYTKLVFFVVQVEIESTSNVPGLQPGAKPSQLLHHIPYFREGNTSKPLPSRSLSFISFHIHFSIYKLMSYQLYISH